MERPLEVVRTRGLSPPSPMLAQPTSADITVQQMLDCCRPLSAISTVGLTLSELACLARCNGLHAHTYSPSLSPSSPSATAEGMEKFRNDLVRATSGSGGGTQMGMMALSYSRRALGQTGDGHFSPVGGYCREEDMVCRLSSTLASVSIRY